MSDRYVCAHCGQPSSMYGHNVHFDDDTWGFSCDLAHNGKTYGNGRYVVSVSRDESDDITEGAHL